MVFSRLLYRMTWFALHTTMHFEGIYEKGNTKILEA